VEEKVKISIFGLGYVRCVSLGCLAKNGHRVIGVDVNQAKVNCINQGNASIVEKDIDQIISECQMEGMIAATTDGAQAVLESEVSIICVGTPSTNSGHLDLSVVHKVATEIGSAIRRKASFHVIVIRSTVLPGTNEKIKQVIEASSTKKADRDFAVVSNPEFLREGSAVKDYYNPPYTLVGSTSERAIQIIREMYNGIDAPFIIADVKIAELIKYVNNAFHANKIAFANEIGNICKKLGIDSHKVMEVFCLDSKLNISPYYLKPGFAYGGSCLPKDMKALKIIAHDNYLDCPVLENIERSNECQKKVALDQIIEFGKEKVGFLGLSFKSGTDDLRESPILDVVEVLLGKGFDVRIYDSNVHLSQLTGVNREYILKRIPYVSRFLLSDPDEVINHSEVIVVVNKEEGLKKILNRVPEDRIIYDLVNIYFDKRNVMPGYFGIAW
jgi:GDP-mannose 6-dehydrogenase